MTLSASRSLDEYCAFIEKDSPAGAKKVKTEIIRAARTLATHSEKYQLGELRDEHSKNARRFPVELQNCS